MFSSLKLVGGCGIIQTAALWWLFLQAPYLALVGVGKGLFSCQHKTAGFGRAGEVAVKVRHSDLKRLAVKACGLYWLPCGLPIVTSQRVHALSSHLLLDIVGDHLDFSGDLLGHAAQLAQFFDLAV